MLNPSRACCCGEQGCICIPKTTVPAYVPIGGTPFSYSITFPGYSGKVRIPKAATGAEVRLAGLPGSTPSGVPFVPYGGLYCSQCYTGFAHCEGNCASVVSYCGTGHNPLYPNGGNGPVTLETGDNLVIEEIGVEITHFPCGTELTNDSSVLIITFLTPTSQTCPTFEYKYCFGNTCVRASNDCASGPCQCFPRVFDEQDAECIKPTFWVGGTDSCCWPLAVNVTQLLPGLEVDAPLPTNAALTISWSGSGTSWSYSSTNDLVQVLDYSHRIRTSTECAVTGSTGGPVCSSSNSLNLSNTGLLNDCDPVTECCCESQVIIRFYCKQTYRVLGLVSRGQIGYIGAPAEATMEVWAYYRACDDGRLYESGILGKPNRTMRLVKSRISNLPQGPASLYRGEWSMLSNYIPPAPQTCSINAFGALYGSLNDWKNATFANYFEEDCACERLPLPEGGSRFFLNHEESVAIGVPATVQIVRTTP